MKVTSQTKAAHLRVDDTIGDMLKHPAFAGFGRLLLPWDDRSVDAAMRLREIGSLLPYHTHVDPAVVVSSLNRMIDDAAAGRTVFHDFYTAAEKEAEPSRRNTGLFFFRGKPGAPFAVIAPGGGLRLRRLRARGLPVRGRDQQARLQRIRAQVPRGTGRPDRDRGSGGGTDVHLPECRRAWRDDGRLFALGQLRRREDGRRRSVHTARHDSVVRLCLGPPPSCSSTRAIRMSRRRNRRPSSPLARPTASHLPR